AEVLEKLEDLAGDAAKGSEVRRVVIPWEDKVRVSTTHRKGKDCLSTAEEMNIRTLVDDTMLKMETQLATGYADLSHVLVVQYRMREHLIEETTSTSKMPESKDKTKRKRERDERYNDMQVWVKKHRPMVEADVARQLAE
ncbi:hypothetical protein BGX26_006842, partial [Mortierella sp. AD094]